MIKQIYYSLVALIVSLLSAPTALADISHSGEIILDQSKDVYFEQFSANTFALQLLQERNKFNYNTLVFGGVIEADLQHWQGNAILTTPPQHYQSGNGLYLTQVTLDMLANVNSWVAAFLSISEMQVGQGGPSGNYLYFPHAFITLGDLKRFPLYLTMGINNIPFGVFTGSGVWDAPLTSAYFNPLLAPQFDLAFYKNNLNINALVYKDTVNYAYHFASSFIYQNILGAMTYSVGAGFLTNLKTNSTGNVGTINNRKSIAPEENLGRILDVNASVGYKLISLSGEFLRGSNSVLTATHKPAAYSLVFSFAPTLLSQVTTFGISHSAALHFNNIPTTLPGQDAVVLVSSGLKSAWAMSVSRSVYANNIKIGLDAVKALTYSNAQTYAYTLDLLVYL